MSPLDIPRIQTIAGVRGIGRDTVTAPDKQLDGQAASGAKGVDTGLKLETGQSIDARQAPVDSDRVAQIRAALNNGSYPLLPTRIADAMIAAPLLLAGDA